MVIWTYLPARTVTVYRTHATTHPAFFETIFVVITEYSFLSDSIPERQNQWTQWGHHCDSLRVHPPPEVYAAFWLWVVLVSTANNYQVFCIPKQTELHPEAPCDHMVITTCWSSHVFASDHVSVLTYRVVNLPSQWSNLEFVCFDDAFFSRKKKKGPFTEQIIVQ